MLTADEQRRVCAAARAFKGTPWRGQGRDKLGIDCTGLIVVAYQNAGMPVEEETPNYRGIDSKRLLAMVTRYCERLPKGASLLPGDIVVYGQAYDAHVGLILDGKPLNAIHCPFGKEVVEARFDPNRGPIRGVYRWRS